MRRLGVVLLILWIHLGDLLVAWLYGGGAVPQAAWLRPLRDATVLALAALCLLTARMPRPMLLSVLAFGALAALYAPLGYLHGLPAGIVLGSFGVVMVPMLLLLAGYGGMPQPRDLHAATRTLVWLGVASALVGAWDLAHTDFWVQQVRLPDFMQQVKGVLPQDSEPESGLPWNFFGGEPLERRAGGLLAAPLAQGQFLVTAALAALALWQRRWPWRAALACVGLFVGIWMSGTRGAMLAGIVAVLGYLLTGRGLVRSAPARIALAGVVLLAIVAASYGIVVNSMQFRDGSTIGHWSALVRNLADLHQVALFGGGLGRQGALAARQGLTDLGGGEGAVFSIAYQMGVPAALLFLGFIGWCLRILWRAYRQDDDRLALATFWLLCGMTTTLVSSDNALTVSGAGGFWLLLGGVLRQCRMRARPLQARGTARQPLAGTTAEA
ncbi:O-antigen ligase family protein [Xanthomonas indica]|uniref:D-xylose transport system permease protein n=1 Tax=Xanthomonas indica TaxID=2912242 RepID=A0AAU8I833_9XANT|nr:hypothetical protein [Xanthomonas indica]MCI2261529.1 hypothetical protein [Xanthomonas indica]